MAKYRGKYKKCRECAHVTYVGMALAFTNGNCPHAIGESMAVYKEYCEQCKSLKPREDVTNVK